MLKKFLQDNLEKKNLDMLNQAVPDTLSNMKYEPPKTIADKFVGQINQFEDIGIRKIVVDPSIMADMLGGSDAASLINQMMGIGISEKENSVNSLPPEAAALMSQMLANQKVEENPNAGLDIIRKRPDFVEKAIKESQVRDRFLIDIEKSSILDLEVGKSTKEDVIKTLETLSESNYKDNMQEAIFYYTDIGLSFYFDEYDLINEIEIDEKYKRSTNKGLRINDPLELAIEIYGSPRMKSAKGAIWNRFSILMRDRANEIMLIRLKIRD